MPASMTGRQLTIAPTPTAHFGAGGIGKLGPILAATGGAAAVVVTDGGLAGTPVIAAVQAVLAEAGIPAVVFSGVHANPTTDDLAAGAAVVTEFAAEARASGTSGRITLVAVGGGSSIDAAKGIAIAAVNPQRGRDLDYRNEFAVGGLPMVAVPTTAGTGAETNSFGVVTDPRTRRRFYVGHTSTKPAAAILDPDLTVGLPPAATAATGLDALTHALESYLSVRANPWADGLALQVIRMTGAYLARAVADGSDAEARAQLLLAAHLAGIGMATTGLGICHAIGHSLGARYDIAHGMTLAMVLPQVLAFNQPACGDRLADVAFALGAGDTGRDRGWNSGAGIAAVRALRDEIGLAVRPADFGVGEPEFGQIAADALDDDVLANTPRPPTSSDIRQILLAAQEGRLAGRPCCRAGRIRSRPTGDDETRSAARAAPAGGSSLPRLDQGLAGGGEPAETEIEPAETEIEPTETEIEPTETDI